MTLRAARIAYYAGPLALWLALITFLSTGAGGTGVSISLIERFVSRLLPDLYASLTPYQLDWLNYLARKAAHFVEYFVLLLLCVRALQQGRTRLRASTLLSALAVGMAWACIDEVHQSFVPGRTPYIRDVFLDWTGCGFAALTALVHSADKALQRRLADAWQSRQAASRRGDDIRTAGIHASTRKQEGNATEGEPGTDRAG